MYARKFGAVVAALGALGTSSYYIADGVSGGPSTSTPVSAPTSLNAAALLSEGGGVKTATGSCGRERWAVKTLTDPDAKNVDLTPVPSTVTALASVPAPAPASDLPRQAQERNVYVVQGNIVAFKEEADSDIHLAVSDPAPGPHPTMIAEFPAGYCDTAAVDEADINKARQDFIAAYGRPTKKFQTPTGCVTLTGVFFFDRIHGQLGVAPNGAELHPVIRFRNGCKSAH